MSHRSMPWVVLAITLVLPLRATGETFELANGGEIRGELLNPDESPRRAYVVRIADGATVSLAVGQVSRVAEKSAAEQWYEKATADPPTTVDRHLEIAAECRTQNLEALRIYHLEEALKLDSENVAARRELGYTKLNDEWIKHDLWHRERGYVKHEGKWLLPQEVTIKLATEKRADAEQEWLDKVRLWREWVIKRRDRAATGMQNLLAIDDPAATAALIKMLEEKNEPSDLKLAYIEVLARFPGSGVSLALTKVAVSDPDARVRDRSIDKLIERNDKVAVHLLVGVLQDAVAKETYAEQNAMVNRAAGVLGRMKDTSATLALIEALVTEHKVVTGGGGGALNPVFGNGPGGDTGGLNLGGNKPRIELRPAQNMMVRDALIAIHPGTNFGFDKNMWKLWYERQTTPPVATLRRDN